MKLKMMRLKPAMLAAVALTLAACGTSPPVDASKLDRVVGTDLPGAQGKTLKDQDRIDSAVAGLCGAGIYGKDLCDVHTTASAERITELRRQ